MAGRQSPERYVRPGWFTQHATEIADEDKIAILRAYLKRWKAEVGVFFSGVSATSPEDDVRRIAPDHPVFRIDASPASR